MKKGKLLALPTVAWLLIFFLIPLLFVLAFAFMQRGAYGTVEMQFTLENIERVFDPLYMGTLWETVKIAVITTVICLLIGYPFAYTITIVDRKYRSILLLLATIPFWINFLVRSYAWIVILRSQGLVNTLLLKLGIISEPLNLLYNTPSVILGMVYSLLPFMILPVYAAIEQLDKRKLEAAYDLGATPVKAFLECYSTNDDVGDCYRFYFSVCFFYRNVCCIRRYGWIESSINRKRNSKSILRSA